MRPKTYTPLSIYERDLIAVCKSQGPSLRAIARTLHRDPGTLCREFTRNAPPIRTGYDLAHKAQARADGRACESRTPTRLKNDRRRRAVDGRLRKGWSPDLIAGRLPTRPPDLSISPEAIYPWIYSDARQLIPFLVRAHRARQRRGYSRRHQKTHLPGRVSIRQRPRQVQQRRQAGHWETDTVISRTSPQALQVTVERTTRYTRLAPLGKKGAREMRIALTRRLSRVPHALRRSITDDNGSENATHLRTNRVLGPCSWFCEPSHRGERGTVENTIGLVRRFFPKKTDFATIATHEIRSVERWLNNRPRQCLGFKTPAEVFKAAGVALAG